MASRVPFTESQWEELENQALVFKYLVAGVPVPPHLLFLIRSPFLLSSSSPSTFFFPHFGWNVQEMRMGRKIDAEPGRCRRTDGKKWRCSKEAYPDSKYCERHMHRGKNRSSRKPLPPPNLFLDSSLSSSRRRNMDDLFSIGPSGSVSAEKDDGYKSLTQSHNHNSSDTEKHCFILGTDVGTQGRPLMLGEKQKQRKEQHFLDDNDDEEEEEEEEQRGRRVYKFLDEWPSSKSSVSTSLFI